jgi:putative SOS response-associated peptidase YedK
MAKPRSGCFLASSPIPHGTITTNQAAIIALFRVVNRYVGNLQPLPGAFPDYPAPVIRNTDAGTELAMMRWGMPPPLRTGGAPVTNIRNTSSPHWQGWLKAENRCLVPFNSFAEYAPEPNPETKKKDVVWFAHSDDWPLSSFAGIGTKFNGDRGTKSKPRRRTPSGLWFPDDGAERRRRADPSKGHAGDRDD